MKGKKKLLLHLFLAAFSATTVAGIAACDSTDYGEGGIYYYEENGEEYLVSLNDGGFTLLMDDVNEKGEYKYDGTTFTLTYDDGEEATGTSLQDGVLTITYDGQTYRFLKKVNYTVTYDVAGGVAMASSKVVNGKTVKQPATPVKNGYKFVGWYADSDYTALYNFDSTPVTSNITLYARFEKEVDGQKEYVVTLKDGDEEIATLNTISGAVYDLNTYVPEKAGETFVGWWISDYEDGEKLTAEYKGQALKENTTLYAVWETTAPAVSVTEKGVEWTSVGAAASYQVRILNAAGDDMITPFTTAATSYSYDFTARPAGEYTVVIKVNGEEAQAYYNNKALDRVSNMYVSEPSVLIFDPVENAEKYLLTIDCGNDDHSHKQIDLGLSTYYNFEDCEMQMDGIVFSVQAIANGYVSSESAKFAFERVLSEVEGLKINQETGKAVWNGVVGATSYRVQVGSDVYVTTATNVSLKEYTGEVTVKVTPVADGYLSPVATELTQTLGYLAAPTNVRVEMDGTQRVIKWEGDAASYVVKINGQPNTVTGNTMAWPTDGEYQIADKAYKVSVMAMGENDTYSLYTDEVEVYYNTLRGVNYSAGVVTWNGVVGAKGYNVYLNNRKVTSKPITDNKYTLELNKAGENVIQVTYLSVIDIESAKVQTTVNAYKITLDVRGGTNANTGNAIYRAASDPLKLPTSMVKTGYTFQGWYTVPDGPKVNGAKYDDVTFQGGKDKVLYAYWKAVESEITLTVDETDGLFGMGADDAPVLSTTNKVAYNEEFQLSVPKSTSTALVFGGWKTENGVLITDPLGKGIGVWSMEYGEAPLQAEWIEVLAFTANMDDTYTVKKGEGINYVTEVTIPEKYQGKDVTDVEASAFLSCATLKTINLPDTIERVFIGLGGATATGSAFKGCSALKNINVYETGHAQSPVFSSSDGVLIRVINGQKELYYVPQAKVGQFVVPEGIASLPRNIFTGSQLEKITVAASVTSVAGSSFYNAKVQEVVFKNGGTTLAFGENAFAGCLYLKDLTLPTHLTTWDASIAEGAKNLQNIFVDGEGVYSDIDGVLCNADGDAIVYCPRGRQGDYTVPTDIEVIGEKAFADCTRLTSVVFSEYLEEIKANAFAGCVRLGTIQFKPSTVDMAIREGAFANCTALSALELPSNLKVLETLAFANTANLKEVIIESTTGLSFAENVFAEEGSKGFVTTVEIRQYTEAFAIADVFNGCKILELNVHKDNANYEEVDGVLYNEAKTQLLYYPYGRTETSYTIESGVTVIGAHIFENRTNLTSFVVGTQIEAIGDYAFAGTNISSFTFAPGRTADQKLTVGNYAFANTSALGEVDFTNSNATVFGSGVFKDSSLTKITLPATLEKMGSYDEDGNLTALDCFDGCSDLEAFVVANGNEAFGADDGLLYGVTGGKVTDLYVVPAGKTGAVDIPKTVTNVWSKAFYNNSNITSVTFSEGLDGELTFGDQVFYGATGLTSITLPEGVTALGDSMFSGCISLSSITIPKSVKTIGYQTFRDCSLLKDVTFTKGRTAEQTLTFATTYKEGTTTHYGYTFYGCVSLSKIEFPEGTTNIPSYMFYNVVSLEKATIPSTVEVIEKYAFSRSGLSEIVFSANEDEDLTSKLTTLKQDAFSYSLITNVRIPDSVSSIESNVFMQTSALKEATMPASYNAATSKERIFNGSAVEKVIFANGATEIGASSFVNASKLKEVVLPASVKKIASTAFYASNASGSVLEKINLENVEEIGAQAFYWCDNLKEVDLSNVKKLGNMAFTYCKTLKTVTVPETATTIEASAFSNCTGLQEATIKAPVVGVSMFATCTALKKVTIYSEKVGILAFSGAADLQTVVFAPTEVEGEGGAKTYVHKLKTICGDAFMNCSDLSTITTSTTVTDADKGTAKFPSTLTDIGGGAFAECAGMEKLILPENLEKLWDAEKDEILDKDGKMCDMLYTYGSFYGCSSLKEVTIPESLTYIGSLAFADCTDLESITIHKDVTNIGHSAFMNCGTTAKTDDETPVDIAFNVTIETDEETHKSALANIGASAFAGASMTSLTIPETVDNLNVGANLVSGCTLTTLTLPSTLQYTVGLVDGATIGTLVATNIDFKADNDNLVLLSADGKTLLSIYGKGNVYETPEAGGDPVLVEGKFAIPEGVETMANGIFAGKTWLTEIVLPSTLTAISANAFNGCTGLKSVTVPAAVTAIGNNAFEGCTNLATITFTAGEDDAYAIQNIGVAAFKGTGLTSFTFHEKVAVIAESAFENTSKLTSITVPITVTSIGRNAFAGSALQTVDIKGAEVLNIGESAFAKSALTAVTLPSNVNMVGASAFANCSALTTVNWNTNAAIGDSAFASSAVATVNFAGDLTTFTAVGTKAFYACTKLSTISLPDSTRTLGDSAFESTGLTSFKFPSSVVIASSAESKKLFAHCTKLASVDFNGANIQAIPKQMFYFYKKNSKDASALRSIVIPDTVTTIGMAAFGSHSLQSVTLGKNVNTIGDMAFAYINSENTTASKKGEPICYGLYTPRDKIVTTQNTLTNFIIPEDSALTTIGQYAFSQNSKLQSVDLPDTVTEIGNWAFQACTSMKTVSFGSGLSTLGQAAFSACPIDNLDLSNTSLIEIGTSAFMGVSVTDARGRKTTYSLGANVKFPATLEIIGDSAFTEAKFTSLDLTGTNLQRIGAGAFNSCASLQTVSLPVWVEKIGYSGTTYMGMPFTGCTALEAVVVQDGCAFYKTDEYGLLYDATGLLLLCPEKNAGDGFGSLTFGAGTTFGKGAFAGCTGVLDVTLPNTLEVIPAGLFKGSNVRRVVIPEGVKEIANSAFEGCTSLTVVELPSTLQKIGSAAFRATKLSSLVIPENVTRIGERAFKDITELTEVTLNNKLEYIGRYAFAKTSIETIVIPASVVQLGGSYDGSAISTGSGNSSTRPGQGGMIVKPGLTPGDGFGGGGSSTSSVPADDADQNTCSRVFKDCDKLESVVFEGYPSLMYGYTFEGCGKLTSVEFNGAWAKLEDGMFAECAILTDITIPDTVAVISEKAFYKTNIQTINLPVGVRVVEPRAFEACESLMTFTVDEANEVFTAVDGVLWTKDETTVVIYPAAKTGEVTFEEGVRFAEYAFVNSKLSRVTLPTDLTSIAEGLFYESAVDVTLHEGITFIDNHAFAYNTGIKTLVLPASFTDTLRFNAYLFQGSAIETVIIKGDAKFTSNTPSSTFAFADCTSLKTVIFEADITDTLYKGLFHRSTVEEIIFKGNVDTLYTMFEEYKAPNIKRIVFEKDVAGLGSSGTGKVFMGAESLETVEFLGSIGEIAKDAFNGCTSLKEIYLPANIGRIINGSVYKAFGGFTGTIYTPLTKAEAEEQYGADWYDKATVVYEAGKAPKSALNVKDGVNNVHVVDQAVSYYAYEASAAGSVKLTATGATAVVVDADGKALTAGTDGSYTVAKGTVYVKVTVTTGAATASFEVDFTANDGSEGGDDTTGGDDDQTGGTTGGDTTGGDDDQSGGTTGGDTGGSLNPGTGTRPLNPKPGTSLRG